MDPNNYIILRPEHQHTMKFKNHRFRKISVFHSHVNQPPLYPNGISHREPGSNALVELPLHCTASAWGQVIASQNVNRVSLLSGLSPYHLPHNTHCNRLLTSPATPPILAPFTPTCRGRILDGCLQIQGCRNHPSIMEQRITRMRSCCIDHARAWLVIFHETTWNIIQCISIRVESLLFPNIIYVERVDWWMNQ